MIKRPVGAHCLTGVYFLFAMCGAAWGQVGQGTLSGSVGDASGAMVPGATLTLVNVATQGRWTGASTSAGDYTITNLPPGVYDLTVESAGFKEYVQRGITVSVGATSTVNVVLQIGQASQTVEVQADASPLKTDTSDVSTSVTAQTILDLPLQVGGEVRNPIQFVQLVPGFTGSVSNSLTSTEAFKFNGGQAGGSDILVDGASITLASPNLQTNYGLSVEGVGEFRVLTNTFPAEYGRSTGGIINLVTKSGTNALNGSMYDFLRNRVLDANSWFGNERGVDTPVDTQNDFGFLLSGPVYIPKIYNGHNKTFFMVDYEGYRFNSGGTGLATYPTEAFKKGDFSALLPGTVIYDPTTCAPGPCKPFANNVIPTQNLSPVSAALNKLLPTTSNNSLSNNTTVGSDSTTSTNMYTVKIDQQFSDKQKLYGSFSQNKGTITGTSTLGPLFKSTYDQSTIYLRVGHDYIFTPTLFNHFNVGFSRRFREELDGSGTFGKNIPKQIGLTGVQQTTVPCVNWEGLSKALGCGASQFADNNFQYDDNIGWVRGKHTFKFGVDARLQQYNTRRLTYTSGNFDFSALQTASVLDSSSGYSFASYMLGDVHTGQLNLGKGEGVRISYYGLFAQDDYKVTSRLTLNVGLRYEIPVPASEAHDRISYLDPTLPNPGAGGILGAYAFTGSGAGRNGLHRPQSIWWKSLGPRVGLAYQVTPTTVIRSGYGIYYSSLRVSGFGDNDNLGFFGQANLTSPGGITPAFNWNGGFPSNFPHPPFIDPTVANGQNPTMILTSDGRPGTVQNWTFDIQRQIGKDALLDVAYVGAHGDHLQSYMRNPNQANPVYLSKGACLDVSLASQTTNPACAGQTPVALPYAGFSGTVAQALRPFPQYSDIALENSFSPQPFGFYTYHALQTKFQKRFSVGLSLLATYTFSKNITDADSEFPSQSGWNNDGAGPTQDNYNQKAEKSLSQLDMPHSVILSYTYELPIGPGKPFLNAHGVAGKILGGWHVSGIQTYHSGIPTGVVAQGVDNGIFANATPVRANLINGVPEKGWSGSFNPITDRFFNPGAFAAPSNFSLGNAPRALPLREFATVNEDLVLGKTTSIFERLNLDLRADFFNALNHHRFYGANNNVNDPNNFGVINSVSGPRSIQLGAKITF